MAGVEVSWNATSTYMGNKRYKLTKKTQETAETCGLGVIGLVPEEQFCPSSVLPW